MQPTARSVAVEALRASDGDWKQAAEIITERLHVDRALYDELVDPLIARAVWQLVRVTAGQERIKYWRHAHDDAPPNTDPADADRGLHAMAVSLLDYPLRNGARLGNATQAQVIDDADWLLQIGRINTQRGRWLAAVADAMGDAATVADALSHSDLERLQAQAEKGVLA